MGLHCTVRQCKKIPPLHQFSPIIPHVFLAFSLKLKKRDISVGYTKVSIFGLFGHFIAHGAKNTRTHHKDDDKTKTTLHKGSEFKATQKGEQSH